MNKSVLAAQMRDQGKSVAEIAAHFGWTEKTARELISRGRNMTYFMEYHRLWQRINYTLRSEIRDY